MARRRRGVPTSCCLLGAGALLLLATLAMNVTVWSSLSRSHDALASAAMRAGHDADSDSAVDAEHPQDDQDAERDDQPRQPFVCPISATGRQCRLLPTTEGVAADACATAVDAATGRPVPDSIEPCLAESVLRAIAELAGDHVYSGAGVMCGVDVGVDTCACDVGGDAASAVEVPCERSMKAPCQAVCSAALSRVGERMAAEAAGRGRGRAGVHEPPLDLTRKIFETFGSNVRITSRDRVTPEHAARYEPLPYGTVAGYYTGGTGIVMWSGGQRLATAFANALYIKRVLKTALPIQIWTHEGEGRPSQGMLEQSRLHDITFWMLTDANGGYAHFRWEDRWMSGDDTIIRKGTNTMMEHLQMMKHRDRRDFILPERYLPVAVKPIPILLSNFETVVFLDDDIVPLEDPVGLLRLMEEEEADTGGSGSSSPKHPGRRRHAAVFWRDLWSMYRRAPIWEYFKFPGGTEEDATYPAQESSVSIISKAALSGAGFACLSTTAYMTFHHRVFYPAVYANAAGEEAIGSGDKDMFHVAWLVRGVPYRFMPYPSIVGFAADGCGHSLGQPDETGRVALLHFNGVKFKYEQYKRRQLNNISGYVGHRYFLKPAPPRAALNKTQQEELYLYEPNGWDGRSRGQTSGVVWMNHTDVLSMCLVFLKGTGEPMTYRWEVENTYLEHVKRVFSAGYTSEFIEHIPTPAPTHMPRTNTPRSPGDGFFIGLKRNRAGGGIPKFGAAQHSAAVLGRDVRLQDDVLRALNFLSRGPLPREPGHGA